MKLTAPQVRSSMAMYLSQFGHAAWNPVLVTNPDLAICNTGID